ncbi:hypothetical protein L1887_56968 [Cichorium endivia]|nr:hypothetical protein L1887_56968 [Cichorium endivia]
MAQTAPKRGSDRRSISNGFVPTASFERAMATMRTVLRMGVCGDARRQMSSSAQAKVRIGGLLISKMTRARSTGKGDEGRVARVPVEFDVRQSFPGKAMGVDSPACESRALEVKGSDRVRSGEWEGIGRGGERGRRITMGVDGRQEMAGGSRWQRIQNCTVVSPVT